MGSHFPDKRCFNAGVTVKTIVHATGIDRWFIYQLLEICRIEKELAHHTLDSLPDALLKEAKQHGFSDEQISRIMQHMCTEEQVYEKKITWNNRVYKMVDTCSAEFEAKTLFLQHI